MAKWQLRRIYLDKSGYTNGQNGQKAGTYYGIGDPLFEAVDEDMKILKGFEAFRAKTRDAAKEYIIRVWDKDAKFYKG